MINTLIKCFSIICLLSSTCTGQVTFQKIYSVNGVAVGNDGIPTNDGGYIIAGQIGLSGINNYKIYLVKTDLNGEIQWTKYYGGVDEYYAFSIKQTYDNGFIITGNSNLSNNPNVFLLKTDSIGNLIWLKEYDSSDNDFGRCVIQTKDSGYIIVGNTIYSSVGRPDVLVIKTNDSGVLLWNKSYHCYDGYDYGMSIQKTSDEGYIISGSQDTTGIGSDIWLIKIDSLGNKDWTRTYGHGRGNSVIQTFDKGYVIAGYNWINPIYSAILLKTDSIGNVEWEKLYHVGDTSNNNFAYSVKQTVDSGFIIVGTHGHFDDYDILLFKTDANGNIIWTKFYGGFVNDVGYSVNQTIDGGYAVFGYTYNFGLGTTSNFYFIKTDSIGNSGCNNLNATYSVVASSLNSIPNSFVNTFIMTTTSPPILIDSTGFVKDLCSSLGINDDSIKFGIKSIFPNPSNGNISIEFSNFINKGSIDIHNLYGSKIFYESFSNSTSMQVQLNNILPGVYFIRLFDGLKQYGCKIIIDSN